MKTDIKKGDTVICINNKPLEGNKIGPALEVEKTYTVIRVLTDENGNDHLDVGLKSKINFVRCWEKKIELPEGDAIHWCYPARFQKG